MKLNGITNTPNEPKATNNMEQLILFTKLVETGKRLQAEGKDIFSGVFYGGDPANIQLSYTRRGDVVDITYCFYDKMYNFTTAELSEP